MTFDTGGSRPSLPSNAPRRSSPLSSASKPWGGYHGENVSIGEIAAPWPCVDVLNQPPGPIYPSPYAWSTTQSTLSTYILVCEEGCTSHSDDVHEAVAMLQAYRSTANQLSPGHWSPETGAWVPGQSSTNAGGGRFWSTSGNPQGLVHPSMSQPMQNSDLLTTCMSPLLFAFKTSPR